MGCGSVMGPVVCFSEQGGAGREGVSQGQCSRAGGGVGEEGGYRGGDQGGAEGVDVLRGGGGCGGVDAVGQISVNGICADMLLA